MKKSITLFFLLFFYSSINAQAPSWLWAKSAGGIADEYGMDMARDSNGNVVVVGGFVSSSIQFDNIVLNNTGGTENFIVKYSPDGTVLWAKSFGGVSSDGVRSVKIDSNNNIVVTGYFSSDSITIGTLTASESSSNISADMFIAKLDSNGNALWLKTSGGMWDDSFTDIAIDSSGNIFATGSFEGPSISFGSIAVTGLGPGHSKVCLVKYDPNGNALWVKTAGGTSTDVGYSVAVDSIGNVYVCGYLVSPTITFGTITLTNSGGSDGFVIKHDTNGTALWGRTIGGNSTDDANDMAIDSNNNLYVMGYYYSPSLTFGATTITNAGNRDFYIAKYNASGTPLFIKKGGGNDLDTLTSITIDSSDNLYASGWFWGNSMTIEGNVLNRVGDNDLFVLKYTDSGVLNWFKKVDGGTNYIHANSVLATAIGELYMTGYFSTNTINFDSILLNNPSAFTEQFYLSKLDYQILNNDNYFLNQKITISKNPFSDYTTLLFDKEYRNATLEVYNTNGLRISYLPVNGNQFTFNRNNLSSGVYLIRLVTDDNFTYSAKIIIN